LLFALFYVLFVCKCVLPPGDNPIAVNKYISILGQSARTIYYLHVCLLPSSNDLLLRTRKTDFRMRHLQILTILLCYHMIVTNSIFTVPFLIFVSWLELHKLLV